MIQKTGVDLPGCKFIVIIHHSEKVKWTDQENPSEITMHEDAHSFFEH